MKNNTKFMKYLVLLILLSLPFLLKAQNEGSYGVVIEKTDSSILEKVVKIRFDKYNGYIFPKEYGEIYYRKKKKCVDLDSTLIRKIDVELINQYIESEIRFMKHSYQIMYDKRKENPYLYEWRKLKKEERKQLRGYSKFKNKRIQEVTSSERQYLGYINEKGELIIEIQFVDFSKDPYGLRNYIDKQFISGWHGWFETNIDRRHYNMTLNKLTVNEDF